MLAILVSLYTDLEILIRDIAGHRFGNVVVLHPAVTILYYIWNSVGFLEQDISLPKLAGHYFGAELNNYLHSNCHQ